MLLSVLLVFLHFYLALIYLISVWIQYICIFILVLAILVLQLISRQDNMPIFFI